MPFEKAITPEKGLKTTIKH